MPVRDHLIRVSKINKLNYIINLTSNFLTDEESLPVNNLQNQYEAGSTNHSVSL